MSIFCFSICLLLIQLVVCNLFSDYQLFHWLDLVVNQLDGPAYTCLSWSWYATSCKALVCQIYVISRWFYCFLLASLFSPINNHLWLFMLYTIISIITSSQAKFLLNLSVQILWFCYTCMFCETVYCLKIEDG